MRLRWSSPLVQTPEEGPEQALHLLSRSVKATAVTGQYPLEWQTNESLDGTHLLVPAVPADTRGRCQFSLFASPQVIAGEEEPISIKEHLVPARMTRRGNDDQILGQSHGIPPADFYLTPAVGRVTSASCTIR